MLPGLAAWRIGYAHFRNAQDLALIIDALRQAGMPEWPFGFTADESDQVKGAEIASLVLGHALQGQLEPGEINDVRTLEAVVEPEDDKGLVIGQRMRITIKVK